MPLYELRTYTLRVGTMAEAGRRRENDMMPAIPHRAPGGATFRRIEIAVR
jgi:hypothetical protein